MESEKNRAANASIENNSSKLNFINKFPNLIQGYDLSGGYTDKNINNNKKTCQHRLTNNENFKEAWDKAMKYGYHAITKLNKNQSWWLKRYNLNYKKGYKLRKSSDTALLFKVQELKVYL